MKRNISGRVLVALVAVVLLIGCAAGGTVAWLVSEPAAIVNTFTIGDIKASFPARRLPSPLMSSTPARMTLTSVSV